MQENKLIPLTQGFSTVVDPTDYEWLNQWKWCYGSGGYALRVKLTKNSAGKVNREGILMHRLIIGTPKGWDTDHINGDTLDNRRCNLRICLHQENSRNRRKQGKAATSRYKGVTWHKYKKRWVARIVLSPGKTKSLGDFSTEKEAALAYNIAAINYFGGFAALNPIIQENHEQKA